MREMDDPRGAEASSEAICARLIEAVIQLQDKQPPLPRCKEALPRGLLNERQPLRARKRPQLLKRLVEVGLWHCVLLRKEGEGGGEGE